VLCTLYGVDADRHVDFSVVHVHSVLSNRPTYLAFLHREGSAVLCIRDLQGLMQHCSSELACSNQRLNFHSRLSMCRAVVGASGLYVLGAWDMQAGSAKESVSCW